MGFGSVPLDEGRGSVGFSLVVTSVSLVVLVPSSSDKIMKKVKHSFSDLFLFLPFFPGNIKIK